MGVFKATDEKSGIRIRIRRRICKSQLHISAVLQIRILSDRHNFAGIRFESNVNHTVFSENFNTLDNILKIVTPTTLKRKIKLCSIKTHRILVPHQDT